MGHQLIQLGADPGGRTKEYVWSLAQHGLEMGTGNAGSYEKHAHRHFVDLIYSPSGLNVPQFETSVQLLIVNPQICFGPTAIGEFFFLKFLPSRSDFSIPDKVVGDELQGYRSVTTASGYAPPWDGQYSYYAPTADQEFRLTIRLRGGSLELESSAGWALTVEQTAHL